MGLLVLSADAATGDAAAEDAPSLDVSINAPVGMLFKAVANEGTALTMNLSWGQTVTKRPGPLLQTELV
jgi:hypothetical protein